MRHLKFPSPASGAATASCARRKPQLAVPGVTAVKVDLARSVATVYGAFEQAGVIGMVNEIVLDGAAKLEAANRNSGKICG